MTPLVGKGLGAPAFRGTAHGRLGAPAWGPADLLRDLELRLGLPHDEAGPSTRVQQWSQRIHAHIGSEPFYARSHAVDPLGTAATLLA